MKLRLNNLNDFYIWRLDFVLYSDGVRREFTEALPAWDKIWDLERVLAFEISFQKLNIRDDWDFACFYFNFGTKSQIGFMKSHWNIHWLWIYTTWHSTSFNRENERGVKQLIFSNCNRIENILYVLTGRIRRG